MKPLVLAPPIVAANGAFSCPVPPGNGNLSHGIAVRICISEILRCDVVVRSVYDVVHASPRLRFRI